MCVTTYQTVTPKRVLALFLCVATVQCTSTSSSNNQTSVAKISAPLPQILIPPSEMTMRQKAAHVLNRLSWGARPGEVDALAKGGDVALAKWMQEQMQPEKIPDAEVDARVALLKSWNMPILETTKTYKNLNDWAREKGADVSDDDKRKEFRRQMRDVLPDRMTDELVEQKLVRAVHSERQLNEVLTDFWFNHFNVDISKNDVKWYAESYEKEAIRPFIFGKFRDLVVATSHHPAMLFYLDNWISVREGFQLREEIKKEAGKKKNAPETLKGLPANQVNGLNENYARELMELHTLGVDGGYSQKDVREAARILTGWSMASKDEPRFLFRPQAHDTGAKVVLGKTFSGADDTREGDALIDMLVRQPATASFVSKKLLQKFVSDKPNPEDVAKIASVYLKTDGDLKSIYAAIFSLPSFWSPQAAFAKTKTPLEFTVSSIRILGARLKDSSPLEGALGKMGQAPYRCAPPTGWAETADSWVTAGALVGRLQFAMRLANGRFGGVEVEPFGKGKASYSKSDNDIFSDIEKVFVVESLTDSTRRVILSQLRPQPDVDEVVPVRRADVVGLVLGSPEFQKQ